MQLLDDRSAAAAIITTEAHRLLAAASADFTRAVPACPGWDQQRLVGHQGRVFHMAAVILEKQLIKRPGTDDMLLPPDDAAAVGDYFLAGLARLQSAIAAADPDAPAWTFATDADTARFWFRRQANEVMVHRVDAEQAAGAPVTPIDPAFALQGIDEFFAIVATVVAPRHAETDLGGDLHLHVASTDPHAPHHGEPGGGEWTVRLEQGTLHVEHSHGKATVAVRGPAPELYLGLWQRIDLRTDPACERYGDPAVLDRWLGMMQL